MLIPKVSVNYDGLSRAPQVVITWWNTEEIGGKFWTKGDKRLSHETSQMIMLRDRLNSKHSYHETDIPLPWLNDFLILRAKYHKFGVNDGIMASSLRNWVSRKEMFHIRSHSFQRFRGPCPLSTKSWIDWSWKAGVALVPSGFRW